MKEAPRDLKKQGLLPALLTLVMAICMLAAGSAFAQTAQVAGVITDATTGDPLPGVFVQNVGYSPYPSTYTDASGSYTLWANPNQTGNTYIVWRPGYLSPPKWENYIGVGTVTINWSLYPYTVSQTVSDTFSRPDSTDLGTTEDVSHYPWIAGPTRSNASITGGAIQLAMNGPGETGDGASIGAFLPSDFDMTVVVKSITSANGSNPGIICYRQDPTKGPGNSQYGFGMALFMQAGGGKVSLGYYFYGTLVGTAAEYTPPTPIDWSRPHTVRIRANGYHHEVWLDGSPIISCFNTEEPAWDYTDPANPVRRKGYIGLYRGVDTAIAVYSMQVNVLKASLIPALGTVTGVVTEAGSPDTKIAGAAVSFSNGVTATTNAEGVYTAQVAASGDPFWVLASANGYLNSDAAVVTDLTAGGTAVRDFALSRIPTDLTVYDTFSRADSSNVGTTEDSHHYPWVTSWQTNGSISGKKFQMQPPIQGDGLVLGGMAAGYLPPDVDISAQMTINGGTSAGLAYRQTQPTSEVGNWAWGYSLKCLSDGTNITLGYYDTGVPQWSVTYTPPLPIDWSIPHTLRVKAVGPHHEVWLDGTKIIDGSDSHRLTGGLVIIGKDYAGVTLDDFRLYDFTAPPQTLAQVKALPDGSTVNLGGAYVTAVFNGLFYVEDPTRAGGIKVVGSTTAVPGDGVQVQGTVGTADGEKYISASNVSLAGGRNLIRPLGMAGRSAFSSNALPPIGLLTTIYGKVTALSPDKTICYINDGSNVGTSGAPVLMNPRTDNQLVDQYVVVTGVIGMISGNMRVVRTAEEPFTDINGSGYWNPGESFTDTNGDGAYDGIVVLGAPVVEPPPNTVAYAKMLPSGTGITLTDEVVTAGSDQMKSPSFFYIQEDGVGIRVRSSTVVHQGDKVTVVGTVRRTSDGGITVHRNGEREINASSLAVSYGPYTMPAPVSLTNRQVGGGPSTQIDTDGYPCQPGVWASSTGACSGYDQINETGSNTVGLYCRVTGTVVYADDINGFFYINDGSNVTDGSALADGSTPPPGIRVLVAPGIPLTGIVGKSATVIGVVGSLAQSEAGSPVGSCGNYIRNIRVVRATCEPFLDLNLNGYWDSGERFIDSNGNGIYDGIRISGVPSPGFISGFDRYGTLIVRGAPFMPKGLYCYDTGTGALDAAKNQGFNVVEHNIEAGEGKVTYTTTDLANFSSRGLKTFPCLRDQTLSTRTAWMALQNDPAIAGWELYDEPEGHGTTPSQVLSDLNWIKSQDPNHIVGNTHFLIEAFGNYAGCEEWALSDRYPVGNAALYSVATFIQAARSAHGSSVYWPIWQYVQMFNEPPTFIQPTAAQMRAMVYLAAANHVKGYFYFSYQLGNTDWWNCWSEVANINNEMDTLRSFFTLPFVPVDVTSSNGSVRVGGFRVGRSAIIFTVNVENTNQTATISLPGIPASSLTLPLEGGATQPLSNRQFTYTYAPYQVRALLWGSIPTPP